MNDKDNQSRLSDSFQSFFNSDKEGLLAKAIEFFPYLIHVFAPDGTAVFVNEAVLQQYGITRALLENTIIGKYNILKDPTISAAIPCSLLQQAFQGETVYCPDIKVPLDTLAERYGVQDYDMEAMYQDITMFSIFNNAGKVAYIVSIQIIRRIYRGKEEIERAKEYIETHWMDAFDVKETAKAAGLSRTHFSRLFKKHTGMTPHDYYISFKIGRLKDKLSDSNLSISQAFAACGLDYNGYFAKVFKERTGLSPSQYRNKDTKR
ncbi:helix-turn-helix transcriptional regulator [Sedimentibacter hydroxybenzoicus DSM 7310]|uniref:Helix-turn-helix transcriptional regulator n=1 Tax=Sedimentibacter hydroxybenzoicus DSM 7310 TaxID=1123245 RepID=A0A974GVJ7_SEDHY|nr:AraC family transcriptional regulator [Sedimentibacter hydroxybenzoicus]NYB73433.1 helix-turn-helix transcriptional regulator [Sedimentibacter hydroxybenzoicus DSM 7310]